MGAMLLRPTALVLSFGGARLLRANVADIGRDVAVTEDTLEAEKAEMFKSGRWDDEDEIEESVERVTEAREAVEADAARADEEAAGEVKGS
jgi:hypothetical protein